MKSLCLPIFLLVFTPFIKAQSEKPNDIKDLRLDVLTTPSNPAFIIMGTSTSEITEPSSVSEFYTSVQNASSNFTILPNNLGLTVSPYWWTKTAKNLSFDEDYSVHNKIYFWRYLRISAGILKGADDKEDIWQYGLGLQANIFAGRVDKRLKDEYYNSLKTYNSNFYGTFEEFLNADPLYTDLTNEYNALIIELKESGGSDTLVKSEIIKLEQRRTMLKKSLTCQFDLLNRVGLDSLNVNKMFSELEKRIGFKWDFGLGVACDILNHEIIYADVYKLGVWTNFGYTTPIKKWDSYFSILGLARYLNHEDFEYFYADTISYETNHQGMIDIGAQVKSEIGNKISVMIEGIYRTILDDRTDPTYKLNALIQYKFWKNQIVFFSFGNAFNIKNNQGMLDTQINFGVNLGIGRDININF